MTPITVDLVLAAVSTGLLAAAFGRIVATELVFAEPREWLLRSLTGMQRGDVECSTMLRSIDTVPEGAPWLRWKFALLLSCPFCCAFYGVVLWWAIIDVEVPWRSDIVGIAAAWIIARILIRQS